MVIFVLLAIFLVGLLLARFLLVLVALGSIIELWLWKPKVEVEDAIFDKCKNQRKLSSFESSFCSADNIALISSLAFLHGFHSPKPQYVS